MKSKMASKPDHLSPDSIEGGTVKTSRVYPRHFPSLLFILALGSHPVLAVDDPAQTELSYSASLGGSTMGGIGGGSGGIGGISELMSKSNSGAMVNDFTGQPAFNVSMGAITAQNGLSYGLNMSYYGGNMDAFAKANPQYSPGGWVGAGFTLKPPFIQVAGEDLSFSRQKYYLSLDGVSQQEMIPQSTADYFTLKNDPYTRIHRVSSTRNSVLRDRCPNQANQLFTFSTPYISYWTVDLPNGTQYLFGGETGDCDASEFEMCQPIVGNNPMYKPFYTLEQNGKSAVTFFLSRIKDRQGKSAIWFRYDKVQENVIGSCNSVNTTPTYSTTLDRAVYLKEIYSTNGTSIGDYQTSKITFATAAKTEEPTITSLASNPAAFYDNRKLTGISYYERGILINSLSFDYLTAQGRMVLETINIHIPDFSTIKNFMYISYLPNATRISTIQDAQQRIVAFNYGTVEAGSINGGSNSPYYQVMDFPDPNPSSGIAFPYPNTHIAMARQVGNKFYLEIENWSTGCTDALTEINREHLYEYEFNGTYWALKRIIHSPYLACPTATDFFLSPDGKYFVWATSYGAGTTKISINDLTTDDQVPPVTTFDYPTPSGESYSTELYAYADWFAVYNRAFAKNLTFYTKNASGNWTNACPSAIAPSTYAAPGTLSPRSNNYSGENEGVVAGSCLTFGYTLNITPGPNYLVVNNVELGILHVFANDGGIKDYVKGLESTVPPLPNFTPAQVGDGALSPLARPWFRRTTSGVRYDNNGEKQFTRVGVSENLILVEYETGKSDWRYLYVFGWDGNQLRYLYDEPLLVDIGGSDGADAMDFAVGPDYFIIKNQYSGAGTRKGFFYYKVDLKAWAIVPPTANAFPPATKLSVANMATVSDEDWVIKPYGDYFFIEKMKNQTVAAAYTPALVSEGANTGNSDVGGIFYPSLNSSYVFKLDGNRIPVDISSEFTRAATSYFINTSNFQAMGDRILGVDTYPNYAIGTANKVLTSRYQCWRRNPDPNGTTNWFGTLIPSAVSGTDRYQSSRLVSGGLITTTFNKNSTLETLTGLRFYPDEFDLVPSAANPGYLVPGSIVVTSVSVKTAGYGSTGNNVQAVNLSYPTTSPDGATGAILKNYQTGVPNFKYVRRDYTEGAQVNEFLRDELGNKVSSQNSALIGSHVNFWTLPDKASYKKPGGGTNSSMAVTAMVPGQPLKAVAVQPVQQNSRTYFHSAYRQSQSNATYFDAKNGKPKITVAKVAGKFRVTYDQYQQDLDGSFTGPFDMIRQRSMFQFDTDPCARTVGAGDPCANMDANWFTTAQMSKILSSSIMTYDNLFRMKEVYQWRPDALGSVYPPLNGDPTATGTGWKWVKVHTNTRWQDHSVAQCKSDMVTEGEDMGVYTTNFIGGPDCNVLGTVSNSALGTAALLTGEEEILTGNCAGGASCMGAFGRWDAAGSVLQTQVVHTGNYAVKATTIYGPTINLKLRETGGFMDRKKGFMVSAWVLATANSDPAFYVEFRPSSGAAPVYAINVAQEYITAKGAFPVGRWVKLERLIPYEELSGKGLFGTTPNTDYLRIWVGKGSSTTTNPVYVDDVRLYPADASFSSRNFDGTGLVTSELDSKNEPTMIEYDAWRTPVGSRNKNGMVGSNSAVKLLYE